MEKKISNEELATYTEIFSRLDLDNDGQISIAELEHVSKSLGLNLSTEEIKKIVKEIDKDGNGTIDFNEFLTVMEPNVINPSEQLDLINLFRAFDLNGDGLITPVELKQSMANLRIDLTDDDVDLMIKEVDLNGDGKVSYEEFINLFKKKDLPTRLF